MNSGVAVVCDASVVSCVYGGDLSGFGHASGVGGDGVGSGVCVYVGVGHINGVGGVDGVDIVDGVGCDGVSSGIFVSGVHDIGSVDGVDGVDSSKYILSLIFQLKSTALTNTMIYTLS